MRLKSYNFNRHFIIIINIVITDFIIINLFTVYSYRLVSNLSSMHVIKEEQRGDSNNNNNIIKKKNERRKKRRSIKSHHVSYGSLDAGTDCHFC